MFGSDEKISGPEISMTARAIRVHGASIFANEEED